MTRHREIRQFELMPGRSLGSHYEIAGFLGCGWEGEVYKIVELRTGIERVAKIYYPHRNPGGRAMLRYAKKVNKLKHVPVVIQYLHLDTTKIRGQKVEFVVSEYVGGEMLSVFLERQPGKRFRSLEALNIIYTLASGIAPIHHAGEYHGDLHSDNILIRRRGVGFEVKLLDFFDLGRPSKERILDDVVDLAKLLHELVGGAAWYSKCGPEIKQIVCGQRRSLLERRYRSAGDLKMTLDNLEWSV